MFKKRVEPNDSLIHIFDYINNNPDILTWKELIQMSIDYDCYRELYLNHVIINHLLEEHNIGTIPENKTDLEEIIF